VSGEAASGDTEAANKFLGWLENTSIIDEVPYLPEQIFNVDETGLFYQKVPSCTYISKEEKLCLDIKHQKQGNTLAWRKCIWNV
jgi:hypothetical protein